MAVTSTFALRTRLRGLLAPVDAPSAVAHAPALSMREIFRRFAPYARPYRGRIALTLPFLLVLPAIATAKIWLFKLVVDDVLVPADFGALGGLALAYLGLTLLEGAVGFGDAYLGAWIAQRFVLSLRTSVFRHVQTLSLDFFDTRRLGDLVSRLGSDVATIESFMLSGVASAIGRLVQILFFAGALFYLQWKLALVSLVVAPAFWVAARWASRLIKRAAREQRRRSGSISAVAEESLANSMLVQAYNREDAEAERFERECQGSLRAQMLSVRIRALFRPMVGIVELAGIMVVIGLGTWELSEGRLTLGGMLVFLAYLGRLYSPVRGLTRLWGRVHAAAASAERVAELLDQEPSVRDRPGAVRLERARGSVRFEGVRFAYAEGRRPAVDGVTLEVHPGEVLALVGPSGAGKSTLAKLLLRFYDPQAGAVLLDGNDVRDVELRSLRENVSVLLQETLVLDGTVRENIAYGRPGASESEILAAARAADAHDFITSLPDGYETRLGQRGRRLSGGQRQRIAIARAMVRDAPVLVLDEPTTGLDADSGNRIIEPLQRLIDGRTTIVITHNLMTVRDATTIAVLEAGRVVELGRHDELLRAGGEYARLHDLHRGEPPAAHGLPRRPAVAIS